MSLVVVGSHYKNIKAPAKALLDEMLEVNSSEMMHHLAHEEQMPDMHIFLMVLVK